MIADVSPVAVAMTAVINLAFTVIAGILAARLWLGTARVPATVAAGTSGVAMAWLAVAGGAFMLLLDQAALLSETTIFAAWDSAWMLATQTFSGQATSAVILVGLIGAVLSSSRKAFLAMAAACFVLATAVRATMGHAGEAGPVSLAVLVEWLHLVAMSLWVGCVIISGWVVFPALAATRDSDNAVKLYAARMSTWATAALAVILLSGVFNTDRVLESYTDLFDTSYGNLLLAKIALVIVALGLGGLNRIKGLPALERQPAGAGLRHFIFILKAESFVLAAVVLLAAVLTNVSAHG